MFVHESTAALARTDQSTRSISSSTELHIRSATKPPAIGPTIPIYPSVHQPVSPTASIMPSTPTRRTETQIRIVVSAPVAPNRHERLHLPPYEWKHPSCLSIIMRNSFSLLGNATTTTLVTVHQLLLRISNYYRIWARSPPIPISVRLENSVREPATLGAIAPRYQSRFGKR